MNGSHAESVLTHRKFLIVWGRTMSKKESPVCCNCGSYDVQALAQMRWDFLKQQWEVVDILPTGITCFNCLNDTALHWVGVDEAAQAAETNTKKREI
mgnify:CR=1 FL=1